ncbi:PEGA domain-containing protein [Candidatus Daviesbacteria bacterium]|nr:PEGA domain-containing protein [Candidatus Daviesbacteria bacterium]
MSKRFIITIVTLLVIAVVAGIAILFAKGYTFSQKEKRIVGTGIITVSSEPDAASVYIDGHLTTATNATVPSLPPKDYSVKVVKEGFIPWEKQVSVKEGLVTAIKVTLFPAIPTIYPLTFTGVDNATLSPDGSKLAYIVPGFTKKGGIWVWTQMRNQPISFVRSSEPHQIVQNTIADFSKATLKWSSDSKQVLATVDPDKIGVDDNNYLLDFDRLNSDPRDITPLLQSTLKSWDEDTQNKNTSRILAIKDINLRQIASGSANVRWSPDETKFMVVNQSSVVFPFGGPQSSDKTKSLTADSEATLKAGEAILKTDSSVKVYDLKDRKEYAIPPAKSHIWLPDSMHIILIEEGTISVVDFDGTNKAVIYAGSFQDNFVFPWLDSSRLVIISSFPTPTASEPNLYGINLK